MIGRFVRWLRGNSSPPPFDYSHIPDSADEWRAGDIAVAITDSWHIIETGDPPPHPCPNLGDMLHVVRVSIALGPQMLVFKEYGDVNFTAHSFRKRRPDAAEACDKEFLTLLKGTKRKQPAPASADTRPEGGDGTEIAAPFTSGAVPQADAQEGVSSVRDHE